jgi:O-antigen/teichoic acid export membrane protein
MFLTNLLLPLTGLVTAAFLTRRLGADGYGLLVLSSAFFVFVDLTTNAFLSRASIKFLGQATDPLAVGATVLRLHLLVGIAAGLLLGLAAMPLSWALNEPDLAICIALYALQVPIASLSQGHQNVLIGTGQFRKRALANAVRWISRLVLILFLVEMGLSVPGAILGNVGASVAELAISRRFVTLPIFGRIVVPVRPFFEIGIVLGVFSLLIQLFSNSSTVLLKMLGGTLEQVGQYGAALNLSIIPSLFGLSMSPLLLSTLSRQLAEGRLDQAKETTRGAIRWILLLLPFGALVAGASPEIVVWVFGSRFAPAAPVLAFLIFGAIVFILVSICAAVVTAVGRPQAALHVSVLLFVTGIAANLLLIPLYGAPGAAAATSGCQMLAGATSLMVVYRTWAVTPPVGTFCRSVTLGFVVYGLAVALPAEGLVALSFKLAGIGVVIPLAYVLLGELSAEELVQARGLVT